jgi:hypothetical protein
VVDSEFEDDLPPPARPIEGLQGEELKAAIKEWFLENFEDPAQNTPHNSQEGGYQYIWGGPYDAREQIEGYFGDDLPETIVDEIVEELEQESGEWAPTTRRRIAIDETDRRAADYDRLQESLDELEVALDAVEATSGAIGGNNPPEEIGVPPYTEEDKALIKGAIEVLRQPESFLFARPLMAEEAAEKIKSRAEKLSEFFKKQGQQFADAFSTQLGKSTATAIVGLGAWQVLEGKLTAVFHAVKALLGIG